MLAREEGVFLNGIYLQQGASQEVHHGDRVVLRGERLAKISFRRALVNLGMVVGVCVCVCVFVWIA